VTLFLIRADEISELVERRSSVDEAGLQEAKLKAGTQRRLKKQSSPVLELGAGKPGSGGIAQCCQ
jgi:hypothetical protein